MITSTYVYYLASRLHPYTPLVSWQAYSIQIHFPILSLLLPEAVLSCAIILSNLHLILHIQGGLCFRHLIIYIMHQDNAADKLDEASITAPTPLICKRTQIKPSLRIPCTHSAIYGEGERLVAIRTCRIMQL